MRTLEFIVEGQRIRKSPDCDFSNIVAGTRGYLQAKFHFSEDWDGYAKAASFWFDDDKEIGAILDDNDTCAIPNAATVGEMFKVSVAGIKGSVYVKTTKTKVKQEVDI